jgi:cell division septation protein DedD
MRWVFFLLLAFNLAFFAWRVLFMPAADPESARKSDIPSVTADRVTLLSELDPRVVQVRKEAVVVANPSLCVMVGAFASQVDAREFMARLAALDVISYEHPVDLSAGEGYWVYLQPLANRDEARRRLAELQARGVDSYIIPKGELENGISLGVFTRRDLAEARLAELGRLGLSANLHNIERSYREHWVMLGESEEHKLDESVWPSLLQENISLRRRQNLCSDVASIKNFH